MAMTGAERAKKSREKKKETIGVEAYKRLRHEAYQRRKDKIKRDIEKLMSLPNRIKLFMMYRSIRKSIRPLFEAPNGKLTPRKKDQLEVRTYELMYEMISEGVTLFTALGEIPKEINIFPELNTEFFKDISKKLTEPECEVWEYIYVQLFHVEE